MNDRGNARPISDDLRPVVRPRWLIGESAGVRVDYEYEYEYDNEYDPPVQVSLVPKPLRHYTE